MNFSGHDANVGSILSFQTKPPAKRAIALVLLFRRCGLV